MDDTKTGRKSLNEKGCNKAVYLTLPDEMLGFLNKKNKSEFLGGMPNTIRRIIFKEMKNDKSSKIFFKNYIKKLKYG